VRGVTKSAVTKGPAAAVGAKGVGGLPVALVTKGVAVGGLALTKSSPVCVCVGVTKGIATKGAVGAVNCIGVGVVARVSKGTAVAVGRGLLGASRQYMKRS
jgi:hypothetical protein